MLISICYFTNSKNELIIDIIDINNDSLNFEIFNLSNDTFYILDSWDASINKNKTLQVRSFPKLGGMLTYDVNMVKLCPQNSFMISLPIYEDKCNYENIIFILNPIPQKRWQTFQKESIDCLNFSPINNRKAIDLIAIKNYTIQYKKEFIRQ